MNRADAPTRRYTSTSFDLDVLQARHSDAAGPCTVGLGGLRVPGRPGPASSARISTSAPGPRLSRVSGFIRMPARARRESTLALRSDARVRRGVGGEISPGLAGNSATTGCRRWAASAPCVRRSTSRAAPFPAGLSTSTKFGLLGRFARSLTAERLGHICTHHKVRYAEVGDRADIVRVETWAPRFASPTASSLLPAEQHGTPAQGWHDEARGITVEREPRRYLSRRSVTATRLMHRIPAKSAKLALESAMEDAGGKIRPGKLAGADDAAQPRYGAWPGASVGRGSSRGRDAGGFGGDDVGGQRGAAFARCLERRETAAVAIDHRGKLAGHARDDRAAILACLLPEQPHGRIPRTILARHQPAPVADPRQQDPDLVLAEAPGEMGGRGVDGDDEIERGHRAGTVCERAKLRRKIENCGWLLDCTCLGRTRPDLQADKRDAAQSEQGSKHRRIERNGGSRWHAAGLPAQTRPTLRPWRLASRACQCEAVSAGTRR